MTMAHRTLSLADGVTPEFSSAQTVAAAAAALPTRTLIGVELCSKALRDGYPDPADRARALRHATLNV
jgi:hypothetical protein